MEDGKAGARMTDTELLYGYTAYSLDNVWSIPERRSRMDGCDRQDELVLVLPGERAQSASSIRSGWMRIRPCLYKPPMAFLKLALLTPNSAVMSCGGLLSLSASLPPCSRRRSIICCSRALAAWRPTGCRLRLILPSGRISRM